LEEVTLNRCTLISVVAVPINRFLLMREPTICINLFFDARVDYPLFIVLLHQHPLACVRRAVEDFRSLCLAGS
jgi:hypothetical protein